MPETKEQPKPFNPVEIAVRALSRASESVGPLPQIPPGLAEGGKANLELGIINQYVCSIAQEIGYVLYQRDMEWARALVAEVGKYDSTDSYVCPLPQRPEAIAWVLSKVTQTVAIRERLHCARAVCVGCSGGGRLNISEGWYYHENMGGRIDCLAGSILHRVFKTFQSGYAEVDNARNIPLECAYVTVMLRDPDKIWGWEDLLRESQLVLNHTKG
jgi:hypothetical protein